MDVLISQHLGDNKMCFMVWSSLCFSVAGRNNICLKSFPSLDVLCHHKTYMAVCEATYHCVIYVIFYMSTRKESDHDNEIILHCTNPPHKTNIWKGVMERRSMICVWF
jgi:hypothetical protein